MSLSVIVASSGRPGLVRTVESVTCQLVAGDELLVDVNDDAPWGHKARNRQMAHARGDALLFIDDDDEYLPGSFPLIRAAVEQDPLALHVWRMQYPDAPPDFSRVIWRQPELQEGNVSTQMVTVPHFATRYARWGDRYQGDWDFIQMVAEMVSEIAFHTEVIAKVKLT